MKKKFRSMLAATLVIVMALTVTAPAALAMEIVPMTAYQSADYSITQGGGTWNGKTNGYMWTMTADETRFNVSITSTTDKTVSAKLYKIVEYWPDSVVKTISSFTGSNGEWTCTDWFVPDVGPSYYATVTSTDTNGVVGRVSVQ